eukprot:gene26507-47842_t
MRPSGTLGNRPFCRHKGRQSVKGRWIQKWDALCRGVPSKVLVLRATEAPQWAVLSHALPWWPKRGV